MATLPIVSLSELKSMVNERGTANDARLEMMRDGVEAALCSILGSPIVATDDITELADGNWDYSVSLRSWPVRSITSVHYDSTGDGGVVFDSGNLLEATDYSLSMDGPQSAYSMTGRLRKRDGIWQGKYGRVQGYLTPQKTIGNGNIQVVYNAGWDSVPYDIRAAVADGVQMGIRKLDYGGDLAEFSFDGLRIRTATEMAGVVTNSLERMGSVRSVISTYRRMPIGFS